VMDFHESNTTTTLSLDDAYDDHQSSEPRLIEGCSPYTPRQTQTGPWIALITRGGCSFFTKALAAVLSGASGVIIVDTSDSHIPPVMTAFDGTVRIII
jgi:hypothetical protein